MKSETYDAEAEIEEGHWWFVVRRELFARLLEEFGPTRSDPVLDIGTGTGANLRMLQAQGHYNVVGLDMSDAAISYCASKGLGTVKKGDICDLPFPNNAFSFVFATDVIEHVDDDEKALREIHRVLIPGGKVLFSVPAFPSIWGLQDEVSHHKRRYRMELLIDRIKRADLVPITAFHFNFLLFVPIWLARQLFKIAKPQIRSEAEVNSPLLNKLLMRIFRWDVSVARWLKPPFGVSILVVAERLKDPDVTSSRPLEGQ
jgi:SAM-dependent methyltransferase